MFRGDDMKECASVYCITNNINGKQYVGKTIKNLNRRLWEHKYCAINGSSCHLHRAIRKYGWENFSYNSWSVLNDEYLLNQFEIKKIDELDTFNNGYNMTIGGDGGPVLSGKNNYMYERGHTKEAKRKIRASRLGKKLSNSVIEKLRNGSRKRKNNAHAKKILLIHPCGKNEPFDCMMDACEKYCLNPGTLTMVAQGKRPHHKKFGANYV